MPTTGPTQLNYTNHFDNPNMTATGYALNRLGQNFWIQDTINAINGKRNGYASTTKSDFKGLKVSDQQFVMQNQRPNGYYPEVKQCNEYTDIRTVLRNFGENTHTLADFYAHTNWVDPADRGGSWKQQYQIGKGVFNTISGRVPSGMARTSIWDEKPDPQIFSGNAEGCSTLACALSAYALYQSGPSGYTRGPPEGLKGQPIDTYIHNVFDGKDYFGFNDDKRTHAYWAKDDSDKPSFPEARRRAVEHTANEVGKLFDQAKTQGGDLPEIFKLTEPQMQRNNIIYNINYNPLS
jgi:hypothetical protein